MPDRCPSCGNAVSVADHAHWCANPDCPAQRLARLTHFVSRKAMDIDGLGETRCLELLEQEFVREPADLYFMSPADWQRLERSGPRTVARIIAALEASKNQPLEKVLYALGIYRLGRDVSAILAGLYPNLPAAMTVTEEDLAAEDGIGPVIADLVYQGLNADATRRMASRLAQAGVIAAQADHTPPNRRNPTP